MPYFYAFDLRWLNGRGFREWLLLKRKEKLESIVPLSESPILCTSHLSGRRDKLFKSAWDYDLKGAVARQEDSRY